MSVESRDEALGKVSGGLDLRRTALTLLATWLLPGLGHMVLGRVRRGLLFAVLILGSYAMGLAHDGRLALRDPNQPVLSTLQLVANLGVGSADVLARVSVYGEPAYVLRRDSPDPSQQERFDIFRNRSRSILSNYGTAYLWTAGIMNLLLLFDVWDIGRRGKA